MVSTGERVYLIAIWSRHDQRVDRASLNGAQKFFGFLESSLKFRDLMFHADDFH
jgi:hypothetical protein